MAEMIIDLPESFEGQELDEALLREALTALAKKKAQTAKAKDRRAKMTPEEKEQLAVAAARRRAVVALKVQFAEKNGCKPTDAEVDAFLAAQEA